MGKIWVRPGCFWGRCVTGLGWIKNEQKQAKASQNVQPKLTNDPKHAKLSETSATSKMPAIFYRSLRAASTVTQPPPGEATTLPDEAAATPPNEAATLPDEAATAARTD